MAHSYLPAYSVSCLLGRLRPDFLHRCKWDKELKACTGLLHSSTHRHTPTDQILWFNR